MLLIWKQADARTQDVCSGIHLTHGNARIDSYPSNSLRRGSVSSVSEEFGGVFIGGIHKRLLCAALWCAALFLGAASIAHADILVYAGYYDLSPGLPSPWYGSTNTTFLGSVAAATSSDPDESAILLTNTGATPVTLGPGFTITAGGNSYMLWDGLIASGLAIQPGENLILSGTSANGFDGSEINLTNAVIVFTLDGQKFQLTDPRSILFGGPTFNESEPWSLLGDLLGTVNSVPEPGTWGMLSGGLMAIVVIALRRKVIAGRNR